MEGECEGFVLFGVLLVLLFFHTHAADNHGDDGDSQMCSQFERYRSIVAVCHGCVDQPDRAANQNDRISPPGDEIFS